ncbi:MAG: hypothetical protein R6U63_09865 [Longimicrobiales bacterium]
MAVAENLTQALEEFVKLARDTTGNVAVREEEDGRFVHVDVAEEAETRKLVLGVRNGRLVGATFSGLHDKVITEATTWQDEMSIGTA